MTKKPQNILFIMFDQLRWDYLSCAGHPHLHTPHIDRLAGRGVRFNRAYVQSPICGSSRMSFYTGRYVQSHGSQRNDYPLKVGEQTLGDHLRQAGMDAYLVGKTHMAADAQGMKRLGIAPDSLIGARVAECGFDVVVRDDGVWPEGVDGAYSALASPYNEFLKERGYDSANPWSDCANAVKTEDGDIASGWFMKYASGPANVDEEDSETPWLTSHAIEFLKAHKDDERPWLCHLSYIKPHWPYVVPAPYNDMYAAEHVLPPVRSEEERLDPNPVYGAYLKSVVAKTFSKNEVRDTVIPAYMGLIKQCDDQMGRLFAYLEESGQMDNTMIVLTSDHGDYLGDHWLGEKNLFHECAVRVPMIIYDPSAQADSTRGTVCDALVESIDLAATFVEAAGDAVPDHIIEGRSLKSWLHGQAPTDWRNVVICEFDYAATPMYQALGVTSRDARMFMVFDGRWKLIHPEGDLPPMLFDLKNDPEEFKDLGQLNEYAAERERLYAELGKWSRRMSQRTTISEEDIQGMIGKFPRKGILLGMYDGSEFPEELQAGLKKPDPDKTA